MASGFGSIVDEVIRKADQTETIKVLQKSSLDAMTELRSKGLLREDESVVTLILPEGSDDFNEASNYLRIWVRTQSSADKG